MNSKRKVLENSFLYTFSTLLVKAIGFLLLPIYTLFLTPEDYGTINLINSFNGVASFIVAFSLYSAITRFSADYKNEREKLSRFYGTIFLFVCFSGIVFISLAIIFKNILISLFFEGISFYPILLISFLLLFFVTIQTLHQSMLGALQQGRKLTLVNLIFFGLQVVLILFFMIVLKQQVIGVLIATLIINVSYFIYMLIDLKKNKLIILCMDLRLLKEAMKYSIPLMPHNLSTSIANLASRVFINNSGTLALVGLYSVASQFSMLIDTVQTSVNKAFQPWFFEMLNKSNEKGQKELVKLSNFLLLLYSLVYMGIGLFSQDVIILMLTEKFSMAWTVIPILVIGYSVKSIYYFYVNILFYYKSAAKKIFIATIIGSLADIILASLLVPKYGMYGAAVSFLVAKIIVVSIVVYMSKKYADIGYRVSRMLKIIVPSLLFMGLGLYFSYTRYITTFSYINLFYKLGILLAYIAFIYVTNKKLIDKIIMSGKLQHVLRRQSRSQKREKA
ncbi:oligosaccharide flippase family protein [Peribacillus frigoritolerans]|uniref:oligosaccharide flippase family protein n=1 Tax=Peribacillus frigoritolerans TaxID=450367 RepID=UPI003F8133E5